MAIQHRQTLHPRGTLRLQGQIERQGIHREIAASQIQLEVPWLHHRVEAWSGIVLLPCRRQIQQHPIQQQLHRSIGPMHPQFGHPLGTTTLPQGLTQSLRWSLHHQVEIVRTPPRVAKGVMQ